MKVLGSMIWTDMKRRSKDGFILGYNIIFPIIMVLLLGYLTSGNYGEIVTSYQYYSVVILPFCVAMAMVTAAYAGKEDAYKRTAVRFLYAPVSNGYIVLSKLVSCFLLIGISNLIVLSFSILVFHLPVSFEIIPIFFLLMVETFAVCAIGMMIGFGMKNFILVKNIMNIPVCIAAILAGAFFPIGTLDPKLDLLLKLSPLTWVNRSIFLAIYDDSCTVLWITTSVFLIIGIGVTALAVRLFKKEEFIHGDLPGYEK